MTKSYLRKFIPLERTIKNNKTHYLSNGKRLTKKNKERLEHIYIPPAYQNLLLAKSPNNKVQVIGEDVGGRKQYIYNSNHTSNCEKRKYAKLQKLLPVITKIEDNTGKEIDRIHYQIEKKTTFSHLDAKNKNSSQLSNINNVNNVNNLDITNLNYGLSKNELIQITIALLIETNLRIGCMKYLKLYNSYGLTTLQPQHLKFLNRCDSVVCQLKFIGKKGVENITEIRNSKLCVILQHMIKRLKHLQKQFPEANHLFQYIYYNPIANSHNLAIISSNDVMTYFENNYNTIITPKMFRTWYANYHMLSFMKTLLAEEKETHAIHEMKNAKTNKLPKYLKREIPIYVSQKLNNTPTVCKKKYMNNTLFNNIVENPNYYLKKIEKEKDINTLLQSLLSK